MFLVQNSIAWLLVLGSLMGCASTKKRADTFVPQQNWPATIDRSSLRFFATQASHVLLGTVTKADTEAQVSDFSFANLEWKIYYDHVTLSLEQAVGESMSRHDIVLRLHPTRCEAYSEGKPVNGTLSICQMRKPYNTLHEGERVLVFLRGRLGGPQPPLVDLKFPVRGTEVDLSAVKKPPVPLKDAVQEILDGFRLVRGDAALK
ncbi:hypothetical protein L0337_25075 [candidate division KSB1 bacterium]|nr:hypothetical protein [candidate division KSB1 bacterium]